MNKEQFDIFITDQLKEIKAPENLKNKVHSQITYTLRSKKRDTQI